MVRALVLWTVVEYGWSWTLLDPRTVGLVECAVSRAVRNRVLCGLVFVAKSWTFGADMHEREPANVSWREMD